MIIGTHNSMTYLEPKKWWFKLCPIFWRCQKKTIQEQWDAGVRCFDLRITFEKDGTPVFAHGIVKLKGDVYKTINEIDSLVGKRIVAFNNYAVYVRIVCEDLTKDESIAENFNRLCLELLKTDYIVPFEGRRKGDWKLLYSFAYKPKLNQFVGSMAPDARWYEKLMPWFYAKRMNKRNEAIENITLYDFI